MMKEKMEEAYQLLIHIADKSRNNRWLYAVGDLKKVNISKMPWYWPKKKVLAVTMSYKTIWLGEKWFNLSTVDRAGVLLHEYVHIRQYRQMGIMNLWTRYLFSKKAKMALEQAAYNESRLWRETYEKFKS